MEIKKTMSLKLDEKEETLLWDTFFLLEYLINEMVKDNIEEFSYKRNKITLEDLITVNGVLDNLTASS